MIGYAICGSFCTIARSLEQMQFLAASGYDILPVMSEHAYALDTRFSPAEDVRRRVLEISGKEDIIRTITASEPIGPKIKLDALVICPCTGNTLAKIASGIADTSVTLAAKAHLRNDRPLIIALASNDALAANLKNIASLIEKKNIYFVPFSQDDPASKPHSLVARFELLDDTLSAALSGKQIQPVIR